MITLNQIQSVLDNNSPESVERLAQEAYSLTRQYFGRAISVYTPIYISNYCASDCTYCGFRVRNKIERLKLTLDQIDQEMRFIADQGIQNILILTGESYKATPTEYLIQAVTIAAKYFQGIAIEVHPMETDEYRKLFAAGVDGVTVYQETYDRSRYSEVHVAGKKKDYNFRYGTPERAAKAGMRMISLGVLLGLGPIANDLYDLYSHLRYMEKSYPGVEYSLSFPRLRTIKNINFAADCAVDDITFTKVVCLTRTLFPRVGINMSTREEADLRDNILPLGVTRVSAGSNTAVGGYTLFNEDKQDPQFDIKDIRTVDQTVQWLKDRNFDPVFTDWRRIENVV